MAPATPKDSSAMPGLLLLLAAATSVAVANAQLSENYYGSSCPAALLTIRTAVTTAVLLDRRMGASLLRLHFHDCFGCDASVLLDDTASFTGEKGAGPNAGSLRGLEVIDKIKMLLEFMCPRTVSCADILTVAARDSVVRLGGPSWAVQLGRRDATTASASLASSDLPGPNSNLNDLLTAFSKKGLSTTDMVALSGAHTIGRAQCQNYRNRIYTDTDIDGAFAAFLRGGCPQAGGDGNLAPLDASSPNTFDNGYFSGLLSRQGLLHSDQALYDGGSTDDLVRTYASNNDQFGSDFAAAMVKLSNIGLLMGSSGEIRVNCRAVN
ncbi:hypothetical protein ACQ4PT_009501 [Festuca glaucescens]